MQLRSFLASVQLLLLSLLDALPNPISHYVIYCGLGRDQSVMVNGKPTQIISVHSIYRSEIHFLGADSLAITELYGADADVQQIVVRMRAVSPLGPGDAIEETWWEKVFRPVNLWKRRAG